MNEIHRRTALSALGLAGIAAAAKAGPLNPPAGAVAPTGRTTDEIFNKIPAGGAGDGRIAIAGGTSAVTISQPGSYVLTGDLVVNGAAITITASNVHLDLNGFSVTGSSASANVINISATGDRAFVHNGVILAGLAGVSVAGGARGVRLEDLTVHNPRNYGIIVQLSTCPGAIIRRCSVSLAGATTVASDTRAVLGISIESNSGCRVEDCSVSDLANNSNPRTGTVGIYGSGSDSLVTGCIVTNASLVPSSTGINLSGGNAVYRNNSVGGYATAYSGGTNGGGNF